MTSIAAASPSRAWGKKTWFGAAPVIALLLGVTLLTARYPGQAVTAEQLRAELDNLDSFEPTTPPSILAVDDLENVKLAARRHLEAASRLNLDATLELWQRGYIEAATELCGGNMSEAARRLGINRTTLYNRMESWTRR